MYDVYNSAETEENGGATQPIAASAQERDGDDTVTLATVVCVLGVSCLVTVLLGPHATRDQCAGRGRLNSRLSS